MAILLVTVLAGAALAQGSETRARTAASNTTSASNQGQQLNIQSGTQLTAQLENTLDARRAKVGDRVVLKTTQAVKQDGEIIVPKGSRLIGHVTDVQQRTKSDNQSAVSIAFDRLQKGSMDFPISATIVSIAQARARTQAASGDDSVGSQTTTRSSSSSSASAGGGLLGGVGNTVGGVVNTTTSTVGNVAGTTTSAVGSTVGATTTATKSTTGNLTGSLRGLQITQSSNASASGGSTLSLNGGDVRLESGTTFNLSVTSTANAGNP